MYYVEQIDRLTLDKEESRHCLKVLRRQLGDRIELTDGKGLVVEAEITDIAGKQAAYKLVKKKEIAELKPHLHLYIAPTKNINRMEWLLEKCTEIGIKSITPIICKRSERKVLRLDRLKKIMITAMKQSQRAWLPCLNEVTTLKNSFKSIAESELANTYMAAYKVGQPNLEDVIQSEKNTHLFIGPEGDFTEEEKKLANYYNFVFVNLGDYRLRTETAGLVATHIFNLKNRNKFD